jgi:hypothetical protein
MPSMRLLYRIAGLSAGSPPYVETGWSPNPYL